MFKPQNHALMEVAKLLREGKTISSDQNSLTRLAEWLEELDRSRTAIYDARVALAQSEKKLA